MLGWAGYVGHRDKKCVNSNGEEACKAATWAKGKEKGQ
jgi:hypothetical protein